MVALLPQERRFKEELERTRGVLRGGLFPIPEADEGSPEEASPEAPEAFSPLDTPETRRFFAQDSEDRLLQHYPRTEEAPSDFAHDPTLDPANFPSIQRQARMSAGIGAPELLPPTIAALPDPEYSTEEDEVTFGESVAELDQQARHAEGIGAAQYYGNALREKIQQAKQAQMREFERIAKERAKRWLGKALGNGANAADVPGWDAWITFFLSYLYLMARGLVTALVPESPSSQTPNTLHTLLPPYRPLREPGDFLYFLLLLFLSCLVTLSIIAFFIFEFAPILFPFLFFAIPLASSST